MVVIEIIISVLAIGIPLFIAIRGAKFFFNCLRAPFSKEHALQVRSHPFTHFFWNTFAVLSLIWLLMVFGIEPPGFNKLVLHFEKPHQRHIAFERVQSAGGWDILRKESEDLLDKYHDKDFLWMKWETNRPPLPSAIAALKPQTIEIDERTNLPPILRVEIFGMWHTGSEPTPYYGIWIVRNPIPAGFEPQSLVKDKGGDGVRFGLLGANEVHCITNQIYEIY
jgi:hypothetical protein